MPACQVHQNRMRYAIVMWHIAAYWATIPISNRTHIVYEMVITSNGRMSPTLDLLEFVLLILAVILSQFQFYLEASQAFAVITGRYD